MEPNRKSISPLSCKGNWEMMALQKNYNEDTCKRNQLSTIPYELFDELTTQLTSRWNEYAPKINEKFDITVDTSNPSKFLYNAGNGFYKIFISSLLGIADQINDTSIANCLIPTKERAIQAVEIEKERLEGNKDVLKGFLFEFDEKTLSGLAEKIGEGHSWKRMADGLGFSIGMCLAHFTDPKKMIDKWLEIEPNASVSRLYFEAHRLGFTNVCEYLDAVPMKKVAMKEIVLQCDFQRSITIFDISRLDQIFEQNNLKRRQHDYWIKIAKGPLGKVGSDGLADVWRSGDYKLDAFLKSLVWMANPTIKKCEETFKAEVLDGRFIPTSSGGVTLSQIQFLSKAITNNLTSLSTQEQNRLLKNLAGQEKIYNAEHALSIYWQLHDNNNLSALYNDVMKILSDYSLKMASEFKERYLSIKPLRSYDPDLAEKNRHLKSNDIAKKVNESAQQVVSQIESIKKNEVPDLAESHKSNDIAINVNNPIQQISIKEEIVKELDTCTICYDRKINAIAIPCGHIFSCLECINLMANCGLCRQPIKSSVKVYYNTL